MILEDSTMSWECWCPESIFNGASDGHTVPGRLNTCPYCARDREEAITHDAAEEALRIGLGRLRVPRSCTICAPALPPSPTIVKAHAFLAKVAGNLTQKNAQYGDSAANPVRIFSRAPTAEMIKVRIDDKLSRLSRGTNIMDKEDVVLDLAGYLALLVAVQDNESSEG
jgi:hypothetical protein